MTTEPIRVLLVEDDADDARLVELFLAESRAASFKLVHCNRLPAALDELDRDDFQVVLLDLNLLESTGLETLNRVHGRRPDVPVIVLTGLDVADVAIQAVKAGAEDYLYKSRLEADSLARAILYAVQRRLAEKALRESEKRYRELLSAVTSYTYSVHVRDGAPVATEHSPGSLAATGYTPDDFQRDPYLWLTMIHPDDREPVRACIERILRGERVPPIEHRILRRDGALRWVRDTIVPHYEGRRLTRYDGLVEDITERRTAELKLLENESEILAAQEIQRRLLPHHSPDLPGFDIAGDAFAAAFAGGDYYDYLPLRDGSLLLVIGDASGHGLGPAMVMVLVYAHLRSLVQTEVDLSEIARRLNLFLANETSHFVTLLMAKLVPATGSIVYVNAGHPDGYVLGRNGRVKTLLKSTAFPLGLFADSRFPCGPPLCLEPGELVVMVTDGVLESQDSAGSLFGPQRIEEVIQKTRDLPARQIITALYRATGEFSGREKPLDDIAVLVLKMLTPQPGPAPGGLKCARPARQA
jgi:PAS domain S-box-containing protein